MARIVVIGGSGHVGSYLIPRLVTIGHEVVNVSRGAAQPYQQHYAWEQVENALLDRQHEEENGQFGNKIAALKPDIVVDMIAFELPSVKQLVEVLHGEIAHYLCCSSIWVYGRLSALPSLETDPPNPIDSYGKGKAEIEAWLMRQARLNGFPATCFRPGHIVGAGWVPINPLGNADPSVFSKIANGETLTLPNLGLETLHHVHADDVARWIVAAIDNHAASLGEVFNTVAAQAVTMRGYAEEAYRWFGHQPQLAFKPFEEWLATLPVEMRDTSYGHVIRSSSHAIEKSRQRLFYQPRYSSFEAIYESLHHLIASGKIASPQPLGHFL